MTTPFAAAVARVRAGADSIVEGRALVAQMTLDEKLSCLDGDTPFWEGLIDGIEGGYYEHTFPAAAVPRLGVPALQFCDGPRGVVIGQATAFPVSMARGATFDPELEARIGDAIGKELRAAGASFYGGVCVNLLRHPAWGRAQETYGEDPHHVGVMGAALARGAQRHVMACVKHYALNSMENARFKVDVTADERTLHEVYLPHFRRIVQEGVASVMSAYNAVNGEWCGHHRPLLTDILRDEWGFQGFVISDFQFGMRDAAASVKGGLNIEMPYRMVRAQHLAAAIAEGRVAEADVDRLVTDTIATFLRFAHAFEPPAEANVTAGAAHRALAREAAARSMVLLRNENAVLPLDARALRRLVVVGRLAAQPNLGDGGSSDVHPPNTVTPLDGLRAALPQCEVIHVDGRDLAAARDAASSADATIVVVGYTKEDEGEYIDIPGMAHLFHLYPPMEDPALGDRLRTAAARAREKGLGMSPGGDRARLTLSETDEVLVETVAAAQPRTVVAVMGGSAVVMERWRARVPAILLLWYPGMEGGHALADVLLGIVEPGGRLPFAIPTDPAHLPAFDRDAETATYDLWHGQWKLDRDGNTPAFPFGFGLGYTRFAIRGVTIDAGPGTTRTVHVDVANVGARAGNTVVQVFAGRPHSAWDRPARRLVGFARVTLEPGEHRTLDIAIDLATIAVRVDGRWVVEDGSYAIAVGQSAGDPAAITTTIAVASTAP